MELAVCKACQNVFMVGGNRVYCPVCGGDPLILHEDEAEPQVEEASAQEPPAQVEEAPAQEEEQPTTTE